MAGTNIDPNLPSPHPHPWRQQKSPARGARKFEKKQCWWFSSFLFKGLVITLPGACFFAKYMFDVCQVLPKKYLFKVFIQVLSESLFLRSHENYSSRSFEGVPKQGIQQWRQVRSRPGDKESLNIMLREHKYVISGFVFLPIKSMRR